jgi:thioredoxin 1
MSVLQLTEDSFHRTVAESACLVVEFEAASGGASVLEESSQRHADIVFGRVDTQAQPELAALFGLREGPALLIFREKVVLYLEEGVHSAMRVDELLGQVLALDMNAVRAEIEEQKRAEIALRMRRVCPTARRGRPQEE